MWTIKDTNSELFLGYDTSDVPGYSTIIQAVEKEVDWNISRSSTTGYYQ